MTQTLSTLLLLVALLATYAPAQAAAPSRCRVDIYATGKATRPPTFLSATRRGVTR